jgi:hypothetical protein
MSLPVSPPRESAFSIRRDQSGWSVYALQRVLNSVRAITAPANIPELTADGDFGPRTEKAVVAFQRGVGLGADGVAGPKTQAALLALIDAAVHDQMRDMPSGLMRGFFAAEGANLLAAVNWSVAGGVDCGCVQERCYGPPFVRDALEHAFHPRAAALEAARRIRDRSRTFAARSGTKASPFTALELAVLAHNWPYAADQFSRYGRLPNPEGAAPWVPASLPASARTRIGWCRYYVGSIMRFVA